MKTRLSNWLRHLILVGLLWLLAISNTPHDVAAQDVRLPVAPIGTHPRVLISQPYLQQTIQPRITAYPALWNAFQTYVDGDSIPRDLETHPEAVIRALALAWQLTNNATYRDQSIAAMQQLVNQIEDAPVMNGGTWNGDFLAWVAALATAYDWLHDSLSTDDRAILADTLMRAAQRLQDPNADSGQVWVPAAEIGEDGDYLFHAFNAPQWLWTLTVTGLAVEGDHPRAAAIVDTARDYWLQYSLPALDIQPNGAWAAGPVDGFTAAWWNIQTALAWWTAHGENYFEETGWWYERIAYNLMLHYPNSRGYPAIIGDGERNHPYAAYSRAQNLVLRNVFPDTPYAAWVDWIARQTSGPDWLLIEELLWRDPGLSGEPPDILTWRSFGTNHVFMRSNWVDTVGRLDATTTHITFHAGDYFAPRQFFDQGSLTIWRAGDDLLVRGGVYSGTGDTDHAANYYARTIGGNTLRICDLAETFDDIRPNNETGIWLNDCGQHPVGPANYAAINHEYWFANRNRYETANIERIFDSETITYLRSDITDAYHASKTGEIIREIAYIRPGTILVHDRLLIDSPSFTTIHTLHFNTFPRRAEDGWIVTGASSALHIQHLTPGVQTEVTEGYVTAGQLLPPTFNAYDDTFYGLFQMDTLPPEPTTRPWFLTAFTAADVAENPPLTTPIFGGSMRGAVISTPDTRWQVMFDDDPFDVTNASFAVENGVVFLFLTGLVPETDYTLNWADRRTETAATHGAGTLLLVNPVPGPFELQLGTED